MYEDFYGFSEGPFEFGPDPRFLYLTPSYAKAYSGMLSGIRERKGITVLTGDPGVGKTTLIRAALSALDEKVRTASIVFTRVDFRDLLKSILHELGVPARGQDTFALLATLYQYLSERPQDEIVTLVLDEAQGLDTGVLKDLMSLWAGSDPQGSPLQAVLIGYADLEEKLDSQALGGLRERITARHHIRPLTRQESNGYIDHRLRMVGSSSSQVFTPEAVDRICDGAKGTPRLINSICDGSLRIGCETSKRKIDAEIVTRVIEDLRPHAPNKAKRMLLRPRWRPLYQAVAGSLLVTVALGLFVLLISDHAPPKETKVKGMITVIAETASPLPVLATQHEGPVSVPGARVKKERPRHIVHKKQAPPRHLPVKQEGPHQQTPPKDLAHKQADPPQPLVQKQEERPKALAPYQPTPAELMLKEDAAWHLMQR